MFGRFISSMRAFLLLQSTQRHSIWLIPEVAFLYVECYLARLAPGNLPAPKSSFFARDPLLDIRGYMPLNILMKVRLFTAVIHQC
jgi:hypothetical protein